MLVLDLFVFFQEFGRKQVADTQTGAGSLVRVGGSNALEGGTDFHVAFLLLVCRIQQLVCGQNEVCFLGNKKIVGRGKPHGHQRVDFLLKSYRVNHHTITDNIDFLLVENTGWDNVEHMADAVELQRVSGVGTALEAGYHIVFRGHHIHDLAFSFITPLQTK